MSRPLTIWRTIATFLSRTSINPSEKWGIDLNYAYDEHLLAHR